MKELASLLARGPTVLVRVHAAQGSAPREVGAWMAVSSDAAVGSVGGGRLEHDAMAAARALLVGHSEPGVRRYALGPSLGQCCGGVVELVFERLEAADLPELQARLQPAGRPLALFGGGHVGQAIVRLAGDLPFDVHWIDSRDSIFPPQLPANVRCEHSAPVQAAVATLAAGSQVLVMSFSHAEDLDIVAACLRRQRERADLPFIGLIGSRTKWATFRHRLEQRGFGAEELDAVRCPIGVQGIVGKQPAVIAVSAMAQLLQAAAAPVPRN